MSRSPTYLQLALGIALGGSLLAVVVPSFVRDLHASRLSEAVRGLHDIGEGAVAYARGKPPAEAFPPPAPLTPPEVPRGRRVKDPPGTWDHLTWAALGFSIDHEHYFSFAFESHNGPDRATFVARAHGDLDGDGERSTFELYGECTPEGSRVLPGLFVDREVE
ncbi:MAG TPA: hypothetical protein VFS43_24620 [Polyangiaceae bacterium]|nr:hypothetical protein [Polyangiaceae bacterium]